MLLIMILLIFGNAIRKWFTSARISVSISPGRLSRVSYLYFYYWEKGCIWLTKSIATTPLGYKECFSMWVMYREDYNRSLVLTLVRMIYCYMGKLMESIQHKGCSTRTYKPTRPANEIWDAKVTRKCHVPRYYHGPASQGISMSTLA